jgi:3-hydroxybutyryl-CoA dehydratase
LQVGDTATRRFAVTPATVADFARVSGDDNPVHLDEAFARTTRFGGTIAHGMLVASFISTTLAKDLPGPGTIYLSQSLKFTRPVRVGDTVTVHLEVLEIVPERSRVRLATTCRTDGGETVIDGEALVMAPTVSKPT